MRIKRKDDSPQDYTNPAAESLDEALARLARQDARLNPPDASTSRVRAIGSSTAARDRLWAVLRWLVILGIAWLVWRLAR